MNAARREEYVSYINSLEWKAVRLKAFAHYGKKCTKCGSTNLLHVHHNTYKNFKHEEIEDLNILCEACHMALHNKIKNRNVLKPGALKVNKTPKNKKNKNKKNKHKKINNKPKSIFKPVKAEQLSIEEKNKKAYDDMLARKLAGLEKPITNKQSKPKKPKKSKVVERVKTKTWLDLIQDNM